MKKIVLTLVSLLIPCVSVMAETKEERKARPHEISATVGDMFVETLMWHNSVRMNYTGSGQQGYKFLEKQNYGYTPHISVGYQYRINEWFGAGLTADIQLTSWNDVYYDGTNAEVGRVKQNFYNFCLLPTARFTYLHTKHINLYSSIGLGVDINGGSEVNINDKHTACGFAMDLRLIGMRCSFGRCFASIDAGGLYALKNMQTMYMLSSKIVAISFGVVL